MFPYWNPYFTPLVMPYRPFFHIPTPQFYISPPPVINTNHSILNDYPSSGELTKISEKPTQIVSKNVIEISDDSQQEIQQIQKEKIEQVKQVQVKKLRSDRFLGFKEGIFQKENNSPSKPLRSLRKRAILTRARLRKNKEKIKQQKIKQKRKIIQKSYQVKKLRILPRLLKNDEKIKIKVPQKKQRNRQFGKLKKYLKCINKTVELPQMYIMKSCFLKELQEKKQELLLRKIN